MKGMNYLWDIIWNLETSFIWFFIDWFYTWNYKIWNFFQLGSIFSLCFLLKCAETWNTSFRKQKPAKEDTYINKFSPINSLEKSCSFVQSGIHNSLKHKAGYFTKIMFCSINVVAVQSLRQVTLVTP